MGLKGFETRHWSTNYRGKLAIHAAKRPWRLIADTPHLAGMLQELWGERLLQELAKIPYGCVIAVCDLVQCVPTEHVTGTGKFPSRFVVGKHEILLGDYTPGRWAWQLENVMRLTDPIPARGRQALFDVEIPFNTKLEVVDYR